MMATDDANFNYATMGYEDSDLYCTSNHDSKTKLFYSTIIQALNGDEEIRDKFQLSTLSLLTIGQQTCLFHVVPKGSEEAMVLKVAYHHYVDNHVYHVPRLVKEKQMLAILEEINKDSRIGLPANPKFGYIKHNNIEYESKEVLIHSVEGELDHKYKNMPPPIYVFKKTPVPTITDMCYTVNPRLGLSVKQISEYMHRQGQRLSLTTVLKLMDQVLCRLYVLHKHNMVHMDLKPGHLLLGRGSEGNTVYLIDYGLACLAKESVTKHPGGTYLFKASTAYDNEHCTHYVMDIESWAYLMMYLLADDLPWSPSHFRRDFSKAEKQRSAADAKVKFWNWEHNMVHESVRTNIRNNHNGKHKDAYSIVSSILEQVRKMRHYMLDCKPSHSRANSKFTDMKSGISDETSSFHQDYVQLRRHVLCSLNWDMLSLRGLEVDWSHVGMIDKHCQGAMACNDDEMKAMKDKTSEKLQYVLNARDWRWDWDNFYRHKTNTSDNS